MNKTVKTHKVHRINIGAYITPEKIKVNKLIVKLSLKLGLKKFIIVDADNMGTSKQLINAGFDPKDIIAVNNDKKTCDRMKLCNTGAEILNCEIENIGSEHNLDMPDFLYVDADGSPNKNKYRILQLIEDDMIDNGILFGVTFSKRCGKGKKYVEEVEKFEEAVNCMLEYKSLMIKNKIDKHTYPFLSYGGGRGSKQSPIETIFYKVGRII